MSSSYFLLICVLSLIVVQKCNGVMKVSLQDSIIVSVFTGFDEKGNVDYAVTPKLAQYYSDNNIKVIYVAGYYGGGASLPLPERKRIVKVWEEQTNCLGMDLIVEVGTLPFVDTLELARYCSTLNVTAIAAFPEVVYQASTTPEALKDLQRICDAAGNKLPLLYHELIVVNPKIKTDEVFVGAYDGCVSCFVGVITSANTFLDMKAAVPSIADYLIIDYGVDAIAASLKIGMNATEIVNLFPDLIWKIKDAVDNCQLDLAADLQQELNRIMYAITNVNGGSFAQTTRMQGVEQKCNKVMNVPLQDRIVVSAFAPFDRYGNVNYAVIPELAQYYYKNNVKVIYVPGYYGGALSTPLSERKLLIKAWEEQANCLGMDLICEVGAMPYVDTLELARYCSTLNVTAITTFAEIAYQATTISEALEDLQRICDATGNKLPLLYHELTVVNQNIETDEIYVGAMSRCVSCFSGVITKVNAFLDIKAAVDSIAGYQLWDYGSDAIAAAFKVGMNATAIVNLFPDLVRKIKDAVDNCQLKKSEDLQQELNRKMYAITNVYGGPVDQTSRTYFEQEKAAFQLMSGIDVGYRYPLERPNSTVMNKIRTNLECLGVRLYSSEKKKT